eukprot:1361311-Amphidinium_carterae.1
MTSTWPRPPISGPPRTSLVGPFTPTRNSRDGNSGQGQDAPPSGRGYLDVPPAWDGKNPERELEGWLRATAAWRRTTRCPLREVASAGNANHVRGEWRLAHVAY